MRLLSWTSNVEYLVEMVLYDALLATIFSIGSDELTSDAQLLTHDK